MSNKGNINIQTASMGIQGLDSILGGGLPRNRL